jgi:hypothetical protein
MSPKVTLSIPEDLSKKMEQWRDKFNFSSVFQEAISREIEKKENFTKKIKEEPTMGAIIERLKQEKIDEEKEFYGIGKIDGLEWAKRASYQELKYVVEAYEALFEITENVISCDPTRNEILGDYFKDIFEEYKDRGMGCTEISYSNYIPNEVFQAWEQGWKEAIEAFWEEIEDKI